MAQDDAILRIVIQDDGTDVNQSQSGTYAPYQQPPRPPYQTPTQQPYPTDRYGTPRTSYDEEVTRNRLRRNYDQITSASDQIKNTFDLALDIAVRMRGTLGAAFGPLVGGILDIVAAVQELRSPASTKLQYQQTKSIIELSSEMPIHRASGGVIPSAPGVPMGADEVPIKATAGEFIVNAQSAAENRDLLEAINSPHYAEGGNVKKNFFNWKENKLGSYSDESGLFHIEYGENPLDKDNPYDAWRLHKLDDPEDILFHGSNIGGAHGSLPDAQEFAEKYIQKKFEEAGEQDWRPTETIPEDYYAMACGGMVPKHYEEGGMVDALKKYSGFNFFKDYILPTTTKTKNPLYNAIGLPDLISVLPWYSLGYGKDKSLENLGIENPDKKSLQERLLSRITGTKVLGGFHAGMLPLSLLSLGNALAKEDYGEAAIHGIGSLVHAGGALTNLETYMRIKNVLAKKEEHHAAGGIVEHYANGGLIPGGHYAKGSPSVATARPLPTVTPAPAMDMNKLSNKPESVTYAKYLPEVTPAPAEPAGKGAIDSLAALAGPVGAAISAGFAIMHGIKDITVSSVNALGSAAINATTIGASPGSDIAGAGQGISAMSEKLFYLNPALSILGGVVGETTSSFGRLMDSINKTTDRYGEYSPAIAQAQALVEIQSTLGDLRRAQESGPELARYLKAQGDLQQKFEDVKIKVLMKILPLVTSVANIVEKLVGNGEGIEAAVDALLVPLNLIAQVAGQMLGAAQDANRPPIPDPTTLLFQDADITRPGQGVNVPNPGVGVPQV